MLLSVDFKSVRACASVYLIKKEPNAQFIRTMSYATHMYNLTHPQIIHTYFWALPLLNCLLRAWYEGGGRQSRDIWSVHGHPGHPYSNDPSLSHSVN